MASKNSIRILVVLMSALPVQAQVIHTVAGGGPPDNVVATSASIDPLSPAADSHGNVYFPSGDAVYKLDTTGHLTRVAGQSEAGAFLLGTNGNACPTAASIGDGGPATSAGLNDPLAVAVDATGNLYIADSFSCRVRVVNMQAGSITVQGVTIASGNIGTVAGSATFGSSGDGGPATSAQLNQPSGVAVDSSGNLYIADTGNSRIRRVDTGGTITAFAGNGTRGCIGDGGLASGAELDSPVGLASDAAGNIYIADDGGCNVRVVSTQAGSITLLGVTVSPKAIASVAGNGVPGYGGDNGAAISAQISPPRGLALDSSGNLYIADTSNARIREVSTSGTITTVAGNGTAGSSGDGGPATSAEISAPDGVALDASGGLYITDQSGSISTPDYRIRVVRGGTINSVAGNGFAAYSGDGQIATGAEFADPADVAVDAAGNLYIADSFNNVIRAVNTQSNTITLLGITIPPGSIATVAGNISLHNCSTTAPECFGGDGGPATSAELNFPNGVALDSPGNLYIADSGNYRVRKVDTSGTISTVVGSELIGDKNGSATGAALNFPLAVTLDWEGNIYVSDNYGNVVRAVNTQSYPINVQGVNIAPGDVATVAGNGTQGYSGDGGAATSAELSGPIGIALDAGGNLYVADSFNSRVRKVDTGGTITTVAGNGTVGYSGDGGPATGAELIGPYGVTADAAGNLYVADAAVSADQGYSALRLVNAEACAIDALGVTIAPGDIATVAGDGIEGFSGDEGLATGAMLDYPTGSAPDAAGNLYIADESNMRIRKVDAPAATAPDFSITTANASVQVSQAGNSGTFTINLNSLNGFSGPIAFSVIGDSAMGVEIPASVTLSAGGSQAFHVVLTSALSPASGDFFFNIIGTTACGVVHSQKIELIVANSTAATPTVTVTPSPASITTAQALAVIVTVSGTPTPTGSVTLTSGTYSSVAVTLSGGSATINIPAGSLATGTDTLTANYTPDSSSASTYTSAAGSNTVIVTAAAKITPTVTVTPSPTSITTAMALSVKVTVSGGSGNPTPTGSVTLISGSYTSAAATLSSSSATISIPAGSLGAGTDTLTASYTPDSAGLATYNSATGSNTVMVTTATVQVTVGTSPVGLSFRVDGASYTSAQTLTWAVGASHTIATIAPQTSSGTQNTFASWSDGGAISHSVTAPSSGTSYTATFATSYQLTTAASPSADGTVTPASGSYYATGTVVDLTATPNTGFNFTSWTGGVASASSPSTTITMSSPQIVTANFSKAAAPLAALTPTLTFPNAKVGTTSSSLMATLSNAGSATLNISSIAIGGANPSDFAIITGTDACGATLAANSTCSIYVTFTPASATSFSAILTVTDNATPTTQSATLTGTGTPAPAPVATLMPTLAFPSTNAGTTSSALSVALSNSGNATLNIGSIALGGTNPSDFAITTGANACGTTLTAGASCSIYITFTPASATSFTATLTVTDNATPATQSATLTGTGTTPPAPVASITPGTLTFTAVSGATAAAQTATLSNTGNATLNISGITISGGNPSDFAVGTGANACGTTLAPDANCFIYVTFTPVSVGSFTATLEVADNAAGSPQSVTLDGTGAPPPTFTISSSSGAQIIQAGGTAMYTITVTPQNGSFSNAVALSATGMPAGATGTFTSPSVTPGNSAATSTLTIQTASIAAASARPSSAWRLTAPTLAIVGLLLLPGKRRRRWITLALLLFASLGAFTALAACGGGFALTQPAQTYTVTVTGTSGVDVQTTTVQLTVQ